MRRPVSRKIALRLALLVAGGIGLAGALALLGRPGVYHRTVTQVLRDEASLLGDPLRVEGELEPCTLVRGGEPCEVRFRLREGDQALSVRYPHCTIDEIVEKLGIHDVPGLEIIVEGTLEAPGTVAATKLFAKLPFYYRGLPRYWGMGLEDEVDDLPPCVVQRAAH